MKKLITIFITIILTFSLYLARANALTTIDFTNAYAYNNELHFDWENSSAKGDTLVDNSYIERIKNYFDSRNKYYLIVFYNNSDNDSYFNNLRVYEFDTIPTLYVNDVDSNDAFFRLTQDARIWNLNLYIACGNCSLNTIIENTENNIITLENNNATFSNYSAKSIFIWWGRNIETNKDKTGNRKIIYYSNFDLIFSDPQNNYNIKIDDNIIANGDKLITLKDYTTPPQINYLWLGNIHTKDNNAYVLDYVLKKENIESKHEYNYKININSTTVSTPEINLYKIVGNEYELVESSEYITRSESEKTEEAYELLGKISFSDAVSYTNDYILRFKYTNIENKDIYFYADYLLNQVYMRSAFLEDYRQYYFSKNHNYAFISSATATVGTIYAEDRFILNNKNNNNIRFNAYYFEYDRRDYLSRIMAMKSVHKNYQQFDFKLDYDNNKIVVLKQFNATSEIGAIFWVHKDFRVSFADASLDFPPAIKISTPTGDIDYNNYGWALEGDLANIKDEEVTSPIPDNDYKNTDDLYTEASSFLEKIKYVITPIFSTIAFFYNNFNPYIKSALVSLFIILVLCVILRKLFNS